jgi:hypothetical protein
MEVSNIIALGSLILSLVAFIKSCFAERRSKKLDVILKERELIEKKKADDDAKKADIEVNFVETAKGQMNKLRFYNKGQAIAYNVEFDIPSDKDDLICLRMAKDYLPFPKLQPYQNFDICYYNNSHKSHQTIIMTWDDDFGKNRSKEMVIDM